MDLLDIVLSEPWLIHPPALEKIVAIVSREGLDPALACKLRDERLEAVAARGGERLEGSRSVTVRRGVAVVPVIGPIVRRADLMSDVSGATSTETLARDLHVALDSPAVHAILLDIDSPGGAVQGIDELAGMIAAAARQKPMTAYVDGVGGSAAYWLAVAAGDVAMSRTALVGSIGAVMTCRDTKARDEKAGVRTLEIVSSQSPHKRTDPHTDAGRAQAQRIVDELAAPFVADVARYRGVSEETVLSDFGAGALLVGEAAVAAGMADRISSFEAVLSSLAARGREPSLQAGGPDARMGEKEQRAMPTAWEWLQAKLSGEDAPTASDAVKTPPATAGPATDPEKDRLRTELQAERDKNATLARQGQEAAAMAFADLLITQERALPADRARLCAEYLRAAADDAAHPAAVAFKASDQEFQAESRVEALKARYAVVTPHGLTQERLPSGLPPGAFVLPATRTGDAEELTAIDTSVKAYAARVNRNGGAK